MNPSPFQNKTIWSALTGLSIVLLGSIIVGFIWLVGKVLAYLQPVLVPLAVAGIIAYLLEPVVVWLKQHRSITRFKAVLIVLGGALLITTFFGTFVGIKLGGQAAELARNSDNLGTQLVDKLQDIQDKIGARPLVDSLTQYKIPGSDKFLEKPYPAKENRVTDGNKQLVWVNSDGKMLSSYKENYKQKPTAQDEAAWERYLEKTKDLGFADMKIGILMTENWKTLTNTALNWLKASTKVLGFVGYLFGFLLVPVYLYYFLNESAKIKSSWTQYIPLKASRFKDEVVASLTEINSYLIAFFRGQVLVSLIDGILVGIALSIFQLPYGFLIGIALSIIGIIPFIGNIICMIPAVIIAFIHFGSEEANHRWFGDNPWAYAGAVIAIFLVVQQINSLVTAPKIVGNSVGLHPMTVIFSILFWSLLLGGFLGALLAVPLTAAVKVLFRRYLWELRMTPNFPARHNHPSNNHLP